MHKKHLNIDLYVCILILIILALKTLLPVLLSVNYSTNKKVKTSLFPGAQQDTLYGFDHIKKPKLWEDIGNISRAIMQIVTFVGMLVD